LRRGVYTKTFKGTMRLNLVNTQHCSNDDERCLDSDGDCLIGCDYVVLNCCDWEL
jgi:hypothetical protein